MARFYKVIFILLITAFCLSLCTGAIADLYPEISGETEYFTDYKYCSESDTDTDSSADPEAPVELEITPELTDDLDSDSDPDSVEQDRTLYNSQVENAEELKDITEIEEIDESNETEKFNETEELDETDRSNETDELNETEKFNDSEEFVGNEILNENEEFNENEELNGSEDLNGNEDISIEDPVQINNSDSSVLEYDSITYINPIYADILDDSELLDSGPLLCFSASDPSTESSAPVYETLEEAAAYMRSQMVDRVLSFSFTVVTVSKPALNQLVSDIRELVFTHTSSPVESDYISYQFKSYSANRVISGTAGNYCNLLTFTVSYYTTAEQEEEMSEKVASVLASLNLDGRTRYQKIRAIYDYICTNITYDYTHDASTYYLMYTGYAALVNGTAVCQGISVAFYRLCMECGIDVRVVRSTAMKHAWNIVEFSGGSYYELDATWDISYYKSHNRYCYFLKGSSFWASGHKYSGISVPGELSYGTNEGIDVTDEYYIPSTDVYFITNLMSDSSEYTEYGSVTLSAEAAEPGDLISASGTVFPVTALKLITSGTSSPMYCAGNTFVMPDADVSVYAFFSDACCSLELADTQSAYLNGSLLASGSGSLPASGFDDGALVTVITYRNGLLDHTDYPVGSSVYRAEGGLFFHISGFTDLLAYTGTSIRCTDPCGMRVEYGISQAEYFSGTIQSEFGSYTVLEFGTAAVWNGSDVQEPVLGCKGCMSAYSFNRSDGYDDSSMNDTDGKDTEQLHIFSNPFTFTNFSRVLPDLLIRPYCIIQSENGAETVIYGGSVLRSIQYVASQQDLDDPDLSDGDKAFIQSIINYGS